MRYISNKLISALGGLLMLTGCTTINVYPGDYTRNLNHNKSRQDQKYPIGTIYTDGKGGLYFSLNESQRPGMDAKTSVSDNKTATEVEPSPPLGKAPGYATHPAFPD